MQINGFRIDGYLPARPNDPVPALKQIAAPQIAPGINLAPLCSPVENQGGVGSCTANAIVGALEYLQIASGGGMIDLSRLFIYYNARRFADAEQNDRGATMAEAMASLLAFGACPEQVWPYNETQWNVCPSDASYASAIILPGLHYANVKPDERKAVLASGLPIIMGMGVPEHLMMEVGAKTGYMPPPADGNWEPSSGGHAMLIVGYDDSRNAWIVRNSWGEEWGASGHVLIDYAVMDHYGQSNGFWTVGPLNENKFFRPAGPSSDAVRAHMVEAGPPSLSEQLAGKRTTVRQDLESNITQKRNELKQRLRGPGAGGGYDKGPGVGGGYDRGPGVGGGYDKGPGAGGGYDD